MTDNKNKLVPIKKLCRQIPTPVTVRTLSRWCQDGLPDQNGQIVKMKWIKAGGRRYSSLKHYIEFIALLNK